MNPISRETPSDSAFVSVVLPVFDEERHIEACLDSVLGQDYPSDRYEVIVADGGSTDRTRDIVGAIARRDPRVCLIDNPGRMQAAGLNRAILASCGDVIARQDGHAEWAPDHLRRSVALLRSTGADNVGGRQEAVGDGPSGRAIARAMSSPFGVGGARFRYSEREAEMPTVFLGTFRRSAFERVGLFDEAYPPHEDYELNERIRARIDIMLEQGWMREVQALIDRGLSEDSKPFDFIGYRELRAVLRSEIRLEAAREAIQKATRRYAKRQLTWFRREQGVRWFSGFGDDAGVQAGILEWLHAEGLG